MDSITKTIQKFNDIGASKAGSDLKHNFTSWDTTSVLDIDKRHRDEHKARIEAKRHAAIEKLKEKGFPNWRPRCFVKDDYDTICKQPDQPEKKHPDGTNMLIARWRDKPQNVYPQELVSHRIGERFAPKETSGIVLPINEPYTSDRVIRAKYKALLTGTTDVKREKRIISNIFPQLAAQDRRDVPEDELARKFLYTSEYQASYGENGVPSADLCRKIYPLRVLQGLPDPVRSVGGFSTHHPPTATWQPNEFDAAMFDKTLPRYDNINEPRPYEFSSHAPRIDQIPTYSGCYGTDERRVEDDNPYKPYTPLTKVRGTYPSVLIRNMQQNMLGYTGCVKDHVKGERTAVQ